MKHSKSIFDQFGMNTTLIGLSLIGFYSRSSFISSTLSKGSSNHILWRIKVSNLFGPFAQFSKFHRVSISKSSFQKYLGSQTLLSFGNCYYNTKYESIEDYPAVNRSESISITDSMFIKLQKHDEFKISSFILMPGHDISSFIGGIAITINDATNVEIKSCHFYRIETLGCGGVIYINGGDQSNNTAILDKLVFTKVMATFTKEFNYNILGVFVYVHNVNSIYMSNSQILNNNVTSEVLTQYGSYTFTNSTILELSSINMTTCKFETTCGLCFYDDQTGENSVELKYMNIIHVNSEFGAITSGYDYNSNKTLEFINFVNNSMISNNGGSCYSIQFDFLSNCNHDLTQCSFINCSGRNYPAIGSLRWVCPIIIVQTCVILSDCQFTGSEKESITQKIHSDGNVCEKNYYSISLVLVENVEFGISPKLVNISDQLDDIPNQRIHGCTDIFTPSDIPLIINDPSSFDQSFNTTLAAGILTSICGFFAILYFIFVVCIVKERKDKFHMIGKFYKSLKLDNQYSEDFDSYSYDSYIDTDDGDNSLSNHYTPKYDLRITNFHSHEISDKPESQESVKAKTIKNKKIDKKKQFSCKSESSEEYESESLGFKPRKIVVEMNF